MSSHTTTLLEDASDSWTSTLLNSKSIHNKSIHETPPEIWVGTPMLKKAQKMRRSHHLPRPAGNCPNELSPAAVSTPIGIPGTQDQSLEPGYSIALPKHHPFQDHKVHCYMDNSVADYCRRDKNDGWEFMRQKRRESIESQVGKVFAGSWRSVVSTRPQCVKRKDIDITRREV